MFNEKILTDNGVNLKKSLELFGDMNTYNESLSDFLKDVESKIANIKKYKENGDMANYAILVHSLKSDAKYFGFEKLAELSYDHEMKSKSNDIYYVSEHYNELMDEVEKIVDVVRTYLGVGGIEKDNSKNATNPLSSGTILVVDDSNIIANFISKIFNSSYKLIITKDGREAIDALANPNNLIKSMLLDLNMPNVNGYEVLRFMKTNNLFKNINVAIITGTDSKSVLNNISEYPVMAVIEKPFNEANIKKVVEILNKSNR